MILLKEQYQLKADELAEERYGCGFYDLLDQDQSSIYKEAMDLVNGNLIDQAGLRMDRTPNNAY